MNRKGTSPLVWAIVFALALLSISHTAYGSGFALTEQSGKGLGVAYAGGTTDTKDVSSIFYNPATMAWLDGDRAAVVGTVIMPTSKFRNEGSTTILGTLLTGGNGGDAGRVSLVPNLYCAQSVAEGVKIGLGVNVPFGLTTKYDSGWVGRYHAIKSSLMSVDISPAIAVKLTDFLSAGASVNVQYLHAQLTNALDFGAINYGLAPYYGGTPPLGWDVVPQSADGFADLKGDDWGVGFSFGVLCNVTPNTRVGVSYRSKVDHKIEGKGKFDVPAVALPLTAHGDFVDTDASAKLTTPETLSLGIYQGLGESWAVMADVSWTGWGRFQELAVKFDSGMADSITEEKWHDTWRYSLGLNYFLNPQWTFRVGTAYDESPIDTEYRTPRIPGNDRVWLAAGASYSITDDLSADIGYAHLFVSDPRSDLRNDPAAGFLIGKYKSSCDIVSFQVSMCF